MKFKCPKCLGGDSWSLTDGRLKCKSCKKLFTPRNNSLNISTKILKEVISEFLLEHSTNIILDRIDVSKYKLLKTLILIRIAMTKDVSETFSGIVEVDETYLGGK
jgi:hypothetical protein